MDIRTTTKIIVAVAVTAILGWDFYRLEAVGFEGTISYFLYNTGSAYPILPLLVGIVCGHAFWPIDSFEKNKLELPPIKSKK